MDIEKNEDDPGKTSEQKWGRGGGWKKRKDCYGERISCVPVATVKAPTSFVTTRQKRARTQCRRRKIDGRGRRSLEVRKKNPKTGKERRKKLY